MEKVDTYKIKFLVIGILFILIFGFGYWLSHGGKPYNGILFNLHKLIGLAAGVYLVITVIQIQRASPISSLGWAALGVTVLLFLVNVAAGGLISIEKPMPVVFSILHKVLPYLCLLSTAASMYLLVRR